MIKPKRLLLPLLFLASTALADSSDSLGCYTDNDGTLASVYLYQSSGYCAANCTDSHYFYIQGKSCYCTDSSPSSTASNCDTPCPGFGTVMCGGDGSYSYWENLLYTGSDSSSSSSASSAESSTSQSSSSTQTSSSLTSSTKTSSSTTTTTSSTSSSSSSSTSSDDDTTTTSDSPSSTTLVPSVVTISGKETIYVTQSTSTSSSKSATEAAASSTPTGSSATQNKDTDSSSGIGGGAIAGIVIGVLAALAIVALLFFLWRRRDNRNAYTGARSPSGFSDPFGVRNGPDDKTSMSSLGMGPASNIQNAAFGLQPPETFMAVDQRLNPVMLGERRLSEGSIADERDYSRKILRVTNGS